MNKKTIFILIALICILPSLLFMSGCDKKFSGNVELNEEQTTAYSQVEAYSAKCDSCTEKEELLYDIKYDISAVNTSDKIENEVSIGKLKLDKLYLKQKRVKDIADLERQAEVNRANYLRQRNSITNIYQGSQSSYNSEISRLNSLISQAYSDYYAEINRINASNMGDGYKQEYRNRAQRELNSKVSSYNSQISALKTQWQNKQNYENYDNLYKNVDSKLAQDKSRLETTYQNECKKIDEQLATLIKNR